MLDDYLQRLTLFHGSRRSALPSKSERTPLVDLNQMGQITSLWVTQSLIKSMLWKGEERNDICPRRIYETYLVCSVESPKSIYMDYGLYFETKCIGSGAHGEVHDLPRNKRNGEKTAIHNRIDKAVERFKRVKGQIGLITSDVQVKKTVPFEDHNFNIDVFLSGTADMISPVRYKNIDYLLATIDLKLTSSIHATYQDKMQPWKYYPWGDPKKVDPIQGKFYSILFGLPFVNIVFDYSADDPDNDEHHWKPVPIMTTTSHPDNQEAIIRYNETIRDIKWTISRIMMWEEEGFVEEPSELACHKCPVQCEMKKEIQHV
jgi:hypothetical protein